MIAIGMHFLLRDGGLWPILGAIKLAKITIKTLNILNVPRLISE